MCTLLLPPDAFGGVAEVAGAANAPSAAASAAGGAGAGASSGTGGAPGPDGQPGNRTPGGSPPGPDGGPDGGGDDPPEPRKKTFKERLFGSEKAVQEAGTSVAEDLIVGGGLDIASRTLPGATGVLGALGTIVSGSGVLAEGIQAVQSSKGRGLGGGSNAAEQAMREANRSPDGTYRNE